MAFYGGYIFDKGKRNNKNEGLIIFLVFRFSHYYLGFNSYHI
jgi:hypothetical protein